MTCSQFDVVQVYQASFPVPTLHVQSGCQMACIPKFTELGACFAQLANDAGKEVFFQNIHSPK